MNVLKIIEAFGDWRGSKMEKTISGGDDHSDAVTDWEREMSEYLLWISDRRDSRDSPASVSSMCDLFSEVDDTLWAIVDLASPFFPMSVGLVVVMAARWYMS